MNSSSRRIFLKQATLYAFSVSAFGLSGGCKASDEVRKDDCRTTEDILGPFYRANAPFRTDLVLPGETAPALSVKGTVFKADCTTPLSDALIEFWQSDSRGSYDNDGPDYRFRGRQYSASDGQYAFTTIIPGRYLNGSTYRPSHIHFKVTAPGYQELISQIYFKEDPFIPTDPWASQPAAKLRILTMEAGANGVQSVHFPIYMSNK